MSDFEQLDSPGVFSSIISIELNQLSFLPQIKSQGYFSFREGAVRDNL